jgi:hypothetical protein
MLRFCQHMSLLHRDLLLGTLELLEIDEPHCRYSFAPTSAYEQFRHVFAEELPLLDEVIHDADDWYAAYQKIDKLGFRLLPEGHKQRIRTFVLHIEGDRAWFSY